MQRLEFDSFGVGFVIEAEHEECLRKIKERLVLVFGDLMVFRHQDRPAVDLTLRRTGPDVVEVEAFEEEPAIRISLWELPERIESLVRIKVGDLADSHVFIHAGAVAIGGKALVLPGRSWSGKSTLVGALLRHGAEYLSDEYAVIDREGKVCPFPKPLSMRVPDNGMRQEDVPAERFGAGTVNKPLACGMVLITEFREGSVFEPEVISRAGGLMEILAHAVPLRRNPEVSLKVLNKLTLRAIIAQSYRPEADEVAIQLIEYFNREVISTS